MPTAAELKTEASKLKIKNYSKMKKAELEEAIRREKLRRENAKLDAIRQAKIERPEGPSYTLPMYPLEFEPEIPITVVKGKGIDNMARVRNYCNQPVGRDHLTPRMARRIRKRYNRGDMTVPMALLFAGPSVNESMGVA